jgi:hypothetical protein
VTYSYDRRAFSVSHGDVEKWRSDLRRMTRIYRSIPAAPDDEKKTELMNEASPLFASFHNNFDSWIYDEVLPSRDPEKQSWRERAVAVTAWSALISISPGTLFPTTWRSTTDTHERSIYELQRQIDTNVTRYQRAFNKAFKELDDLFKERAEGGKTQLEPVELLHVGPLQVVVHNQGRELRGGHADEALHDELSTLGDAVRKMDRAGFSEAAQGLTVHMSFIQTALTAGQYDPSKDELTLFPLGTGRENNQTFVHECGHRFYYRSLPSNARAHWKEVLDARAVTIEAKDIDHCVDTYVKPFTDRHKRTPTRQELRSLLHEDSVEMQAKCWEMADHIPGFTDDPEGVRKFWKDQDYINGARVNLEEITDYGSTNDKEAFAEAFMLYVTQGPRAVGPWTRWFFEMISRAGGAKLARAAVRSALHRQRTSFLGVLPV